MSTIKADGIQAATGTNTDLTLAGKGTGVPDLAAGFKVGGTAGLPINNLRVGTDGELITWDASGDPAAVAVGTATHVLTSNGAGAAPTFQAAGGAGSWTFISAHDMSGSSLSVLEFNDLAGVGINRYKAVFSNVTWNSNGDLSLQVSTNGGSSWLTTSTASYHERQMESDATATSNQAYENDAWPANGTDVSNAVSATTDPFNGEIHICGMATDAQIVSIYVNCWVAQGSNAQIAGFEKYISDTTSGIDSIRFNVVASDVFTQGDIYWFKEVTS